MLGPAPGGGLACSMGAPFGLSSSIWPNSGTNPPVPAMSSRLSPRAALQRPHRNRKSHRGLVGIESPGDV